MKKKMSYLLMAFAMMLVVTACGDDVETLLTADTLKNTEWSGSFVKMKNGTVESSKVVTVKFDSNNHGVYVLNDKECEFDFAVSGLKFSLMHSFFTDVNGTYELESGVLGNTLVMRKSSGDASEMFRLNRGENSQEKQKRK